MGLGLSPECHISNLKSLPGSGLAAEGPHILQLSFSSSDPFGESAGSVL
jgi:hypothetical protein